MIAPLNGSVKGLNIEFQTRTAEDFD